MTEKEAIETLQGKSLECCEAFGFDCGNCDKCEVTIAYDMAIKALKKQIPKKPIDKIDPMFGDSCIVCPNCENTDIASPFTHSIFKHCPNCGQSLDWSDTDEMPNIKSQEQSAGA